MSRINVLGIPELHPGQCALCGSAGGDKRKFIDFGKSIDFYGVVYFCSECIREVAEKINYVPVASFDKLYEDLRSITIKYNQLELRYKKVKDALSELLDSGDIVSTTDTQHDVDASANGQESEELEHPNTESVEGTTETNESPDVEGSDDLFDTSDFDESDAD